MPVSPEDFDERANALELLLFDVDGVLTDGGITLDATEGETKRFSVRDGAAIVWARQAGLTIGLLSGRRSAVTARRAAELGIELVHQDGPDKRPAFAAILGAHGLADSQVGYMGDDLLDLPVLGRAGLSAAPADAVGDVRERVHWVSDHPGGHGAVRQFIERILRARGRWADLVREHLT
jgi:3-deoxy-D-manno-octulosonate 8-phosphate phosphatase (KDO 8-P phosphatase)